MNSNAVEVSYLPSSNKKVEPWENQRLFVAACSKSSNYYLM